MPGCRGVSKTEFPSPVSIAGGVAARKAPSTGIPVVALSSAREPFQVEEQTDPWRTWVGCRRLVQLGDGATLETRLREHLVNLTVFGAWAVLAVFLFLPRFGYM